MTKIANQSALKMRDSNKTGTSTQRELLLNKIETESNLRLPQFIIDEEAYKNNSSSMPEETFLA